MKDNSKILLAAVTGAVVGAGVALLLAPASGKETREKIAGKIGDVKDKIKDTLNSAKEKGKEAFEEAKS